MSDILICSSSKLLEMYAPRRHIDLLKDVWFWSSFSNFSIPCSRALTSGYIYKLLRVKKWSTSFWCSFFFRRSFRWTCSCIRYRDCGTSSVCCQKNIGCREFNDVSWTCFDIYETWLRTWVQSAASSPRKLAPRRRCDIWKCVFDILSRGTASTKKHKS